MPTKQLRRFHLWRELPDELWIKLSAGMQQIDIPTGDTIFPNRLTDDCLCVLMSGQAKVHALSPDITHATLLRTMEADAVFGVHCIFNADLSPQSLIVAQKPCRVLLIPCKLWEEILTTHAPTMANYVRFLTQRVHFLNQKIRYLTAGSAERRLALYLLSEIPQENVPVTLPISAVSLADLLDLGRASLYRAIDRLTADGFLVRNSHEYMLLNRDKLLSYYR